MRGDPIEVHQIPAVSASGRFPVNVEACCARCTNSTRCKAWTIDKDGACQLASSTATAFPEQGAYSGYPLKSDPASYCQVTRARGSARHPAVRASPHSPPRWQMLWVNGNGRKWGDQHTASGVACASLPGKGSDTAVGSFPRKWADVKGRSRGEAWFFYPVPPPPVPRDSSGIAT
jgi:hypothetical protein